MPLPPLEEVEFVHQLSLRNFRQFSSGFNFSCPLCNEGKSRSKRRGFILLAGRKYDHNTYVCHNCYQQGMALWRFIKLVDDKVYDAYRTKEKSWYINEIKAGRGGRRKKIGDINNYTERIGGPTKIFRLSKRTFIPCRQYQPAVEYCRDVRRIPEQWIDRFFYCPSDKYAFGKMVIFPFYYDEEHVYGFQGRSIDGKRFNTFSPNDSFKVFNFYEVDHSAIVWVFESIIDSFSIPNSIAMLGADLSRNVRDQLAKPVFIFDNDRPGMEKTQQYIERGERCFIWPQELRSKDFNKLIQKGAHPMKLRKMLLDNIYTGLTGQMEIAARLSKTKKTFRRESTNASL